MINPNVRGQTIEKLLEHLSSTVYFAVLQATSLDVESNSLRVFLTHCKLHGLGQMLEQILNVRVPNVCVLFSLLNDLLVLGFEFKATLFESVG